MVKTTGGPALGASVVSPAMTTGAVSLLQEHLTKEEKGLWTSLGPNWTLPWSVCLCMCLQIFESVSCCSNKILSPSFPVHTLMCLLLRTHLSSWMGGSLRPMTQLAGLWKIPSSHSTHKMLSGKVEQHKVCRTKLDRQRRAMVKALMCKPLYYNFGCGCESQHIVVIANCIQLSHVSFACRKTPNKPTTIMASVSVHSCQASMLVLENVGCTFLPFLCEQLANSFSKIFT